MTQLPLFDLPPIREPHRRAPRPPAAPPAPPPLEAARARGRAGAAATAARAARATGSPWTQSAAAMIAEYARRHPGAFTIEKARIWGAVRVPTPPDQRAWGSATKYAVQHGWITPVGYEATRSSNGSPRPTYQASGRT